MLQRLVSLVVLCCAAACTANAPSQSAQGVSIVDQVVTDIDGKQVNLGAYRGKVLLVVNVASECGYTPQYQGLQRLYERYKDRGFVVLGFPSNDFGGQEPGTSEEIKKFASEEFGVTFPLMAKVHATGPEQAPVYQKLCEVGPVKWNFTKFLVDKQGNVVAHFPHKVEPDAPQLVAAIEKLL